MTSTTSVATPVDDAALQRGMRGLLHPRRIAIIGASPRMGFANSIHSALHRGGYDGEILPVNPRYEEVLGDRAYPTIEEIDGPVELAVVVVPNRLTLDVLAQCERKGVTAVNLIASGFAEKPGDEEGAARQRALKEFAARTGIRLAGPNCLGNISVPNRMVAKSGPYFKLPTRGPVAAVFQSGLLSYSLVAPCEDRNIGFTYVVTSGNEADLDTADFIRYYVADDETRVICAFVEQIHDPEGFLAAAELAAEACKPLVVLKIGRSEGGRQAALAHTGSLVGADEITDAVMRQHGIARVYTMDELIETIAVFHTRRLPKGRGVVPVFMSGGAAGLGADLGQDLGVEFPPLAEETTRKLYDIIPSFGTVGNPLDTTGQIWEMEGAFQACFAALAEDPNADIIVYGRAFPAQMDADPETEEFPAALAERYPDKLFLIMALVGGNHRVESYPGAVVRRPVSHYDGVPFLQGFDNSLRAIRALIRYAEFQRARTERGPEVRHESPRATEARAMMRSTDGRPLTEREAKALLALYELPVTREVLAATAGEAVGAAERIGYPVVLKIESPDISHKTEAGGVLLDVRDAEAVRAGFERVLTSARAYDPSARLSGVLVQEMAPHGRELILGMSQDPSFGPAVAVGLGGIFVEVLKDIQLGVPPLTARDAREMLRRLRGYAILEGSGARGAGPADVEALVEIIVRFGKLCLDLRGEVAEIDINPLLVYEEGRGAKVVDCLIVPR